MTVPPPFVTALIRVAWVRFVLSRLGPMFPSAPAALRVWHEPQFVLTKTTLPFFGLPTSGGVALRWARAGAASAKAATAEPAMRILRDISLYYVRRLRAVFPSSRR